MSPHTSNERDNRDLHPCRAATENSSSGIPSANILANLLSIFLSRRATDCRLFSAAEGGRYAVFDAPNFSVWCSPVTASSCAPPLPCPGGEREAVKVLLEWWSPFLESEEKRENEGASDRREDIDIPSEDEDGARAQEMFIVGVGGVAIYDLGNAEEELDLLLTSTFISMPSNSDTSIGASSSTQGKKFRNKASACHLLAFLNSIHTSIRPGLESAGSSFSRWFVVANNSLPSAAATPSKALRRPLKDRVLTSLSWSRRLRLIENPAVALSPSSPSFLSPSLSSSCAETSLLVLRVNAASRSSRSTTQRAGTRPMSVVSVESDIHEADKETT